jgi:hypothetical protein
MGICKDKPGTLSMYAYHDLRNIQKNPVDIQRLYGGVEVRNDVVEPIHKKGTHVEVKLRSDGPPNCNPFGIARLSEDIFPGDNTAKVHLFPCDGLDLESIDTKTIATTSIHCHIDPGRVIVTEGIYEELITALGLHGGDMTLSDAESSDDDQEVLILSTMSPRSGRYVKQPSYLREYV